MSNKNATGAQVSATDFAPIRTAPVVIPGLDWSPDLCDGDDVTKASADKAIAALGGEWRYPTLLELESNKDVSRALPACDPSRLAFEPSAYWTGEPYAPSRDCFWVVGFGGGSSLERHRDDLARVRAVRSVPAGQ